MARLVTNKSVQTRQRILSVAAGLMAARGAGSLTMADIARAAGMSKGSLYYYFPGCAAIESEVLLDTFADMVERFERAAAGAATARAVLSSVVEEYSAMLRENAELVRMAMSRIHLSDAHGTAAAGDEGAARFDELCARLSRLIETQLERGKNEGAVRADLDVRYAGAAVLGVFASMTAELVAQADAGGAAPQDPDRGRGGGLDTGAFASALVSFVSRGVYAE